MKKLFTFFFLIALSSGLIIAQTLRSEYTFTSGSLQNSVNATDFTQTGTALTFITGVENQISGAISLNGDVLNNPSWVSDNGSGQNDFSVAFWIKTSDNSSTIKEVINHYTTYGWKFTLANGNLSFYGKFFTAGTSTSNQPAPHTYTFSGIADGEWHFILLTLDQSAASAGGGAEYSRVRYKIYIDNVLKSNIEKQKVNIGNHYTIPNAQIYIGDNKDLNGIRYTDGLDNFRYYTGLLDATAIGTLYNEFVDATNPLAVTQDITVQLDETGNITIESSDVNDGSSDNRTGTGDLILSLDQSSFDCDDIGENTVTLTVADGSGNTATASAKITVEDAAFPSVITQDLSLFLDADGLASITSTDVDNGSSDNCGIDQMTLDIKDFTCDNLGSNTVTLTATDVSGNSSHATATVTIQDLTVPTVITQDVSVSLDTNGSANISAIDIDNGSSDNCSISAMALDISTFNCDDIGANTVTLTVTDVAGNTSSATAIVTVEDNTDPIAITQNISVTLDQNGEAIITASDINNGSTDNCGIASIDLDVTTFDCSNIGENIVTLTITDNQTNTNTETATVTINETTAPVALAQDLSIFLDSDGLASILPKDVDNGSSDNCSIDNLSLDISAFTCENLGANTVTLSVTDASGNVSTTSSTVTVHDNTKPVAIAQDITVSLDANGSATIDPSDIDSGSIDNCSIANRSLDINTFDCDNLGANTITLTVTDAVGNTNVATGIVTVEDSTEPVVRTKNINITLNQSGEATIATTDINDGSSDNCGIASMELDITSFDCSNVGVNTVNLSVTDNSGNTGTATATVTVIETTPPIVMVQDITVSLDTDGMVSVATTDIDNGSTDNCGIDHLTLDVSDFSCDDLGANTVILTVTDASGNTSTATATVNVEDNTDPVIITQDITIELDATGAATITAADIDNGSSDNCGIDQKTIDVNSFSCSDLGANSVQFISTDASGNTSSATATVTIVDVIAPIVIAQNIEVRLDAIGQATIETSDIDNGSSDNCSFQLSLDKTSFSSSNIGQNTITLIGTDLSGNTNSATATVNVLPFQRSQTITFAGIADQQYGVGTTLSATTSSQLSVSYTVVEGPASITFDQVSFTGIGSVTIEASQNGNDFYLPAETVRHTFTVNPAILIASAEDMQITYGDAIPTFTPIIKGFVNGEDESVLLTAPEVNTTAIDNSDAGVYPISISGGSAANYGFSYGDAELTILKATATIELSDLEQEADGTTKSPTVITTPAELNYSITFNSESSAPSTPGIYQVVVTIDDLNYEGTTNGAFELTEPALLSIQETAFEVYPNPTSEFVFVQSIQSEPVFILDLDGTRVLDGRTNLKLDVSSLSPGIYIILTNDKSERLIKR